MRAPATRAASYWTGSENYVADRIMDELPTLIGDVRSDIVVDATVDLDLQKLAEKSIRRLIDEKRRQAQCHPGRAGVDRQFGRGARHGRRRRLCRQPVRPRLRSAAPAGLGVQAVRLSGRPRSRAHARQRAQRRADQHRQMDAGQLRRQVLRQGDAGDGAGQVAELGRGAAGHGGRPGRSGRGGAPHGHRIEAAVPTSRSRSAPPR